MAARKTDKTEVVDTPVHNADTAKAIIYELVEAKCADMLKGPDRVNDPHTMDAIARLMEAIK